MSQSASSSLPPAEELFELEFETEKQPVDNELQLLIPTLLRAILGLAWGDRADWFFGINLCLYSQPSEPAIGPDGFLSLGVPRFLPNGKLRLSYVVWRENYVMPQWVLEIVSKKPGGEYGSKFLDYARMGVQYYTIYNPEHGPRDQHDSFEVYRLVDGSYIRQAGNPVWMPELGLGIGCDRGTHEGLTREWLYWYDEAGNRLPAPDDVIQQERSLREVAQQRAIAAEQALAELQARLRARGIDPDKL